MKGPHFQGGGPNTHNNRFNAPYHNYIDRDNGGDWPDDDHASHVSADDRPVELIRVGNRYGVA